jgi:molecular chaperone DnaK
VQKQVVSVPYRIVRHENGDAWIDLRGKRVSPPEVSAMVLTAMKNIAETYLGEPGASVRTAAKPST